MSSTPHPYKVRKQASMLVATPHEKNFDARMDRFARLILLRAYRIHGNKFRAAEALGMTYRSFRHHWARLIQD